MKEQTDQNSFNKVIIIKKLPASRWRDLRDLRLEALKNEPTAFGSSYEEEFVHSREVWERRIKSVLFASYDEKPVGMASYAFRNRKKEKHVAEVHSVYVSDDYRSKGLGDRLLKEVLSIIRDNKNIIKVNLSVVAHHTDAIALYKKNGFKIVGELKKERKIDDQYYDELVMEMFI